MQGIHGRENDKVNVREKFRELVNAQKFRNGFVAHFGGFAVAGATCLVLVHACAG